MQKVKNSIIVSVFFMVLLFPNFSWALPVTENDVRAVVANWISDPSECICEGIGTQINQVKLYRGGNVDFYLVTLTTKGWVVIPADDSFWPIQILGTGHMTIELFEQSKWFDLLSTPNASVNFNYRSNNNAMVPSIDRNEKINKIKWEKLRKQRNSSLLRRGNIQNFDPNSASADVRVSPFLGVQRYWGQGMPFNTYTKFVPLTMNSQINSQHKGSANSNITFPIGCVPLSIGQALHYIFTQKNPISLTNSTYTLNINETSADRHTFYVSRDYVTLTPSHVAKLTFDYPPIRTTYDFNAMSVFNGNNYTSNISQQISQHIAPLLRDIGVSLGAMYSKPETATNLYNTPNLLINTFGFQENNPKAIQIDTNMLLPDEERNNVINTNLDLGFPVIYGMNFGVESGGGGHAWLHF